MTNASNGSASPVSAGRRRRVARRHYRSPHERLQAGEPVDPETLAREYPEHAERLRRLLPALELMADLGRSPHPTRRRADRPRYGAWPGDRHPRRLPHPPRGRPRRHGGRLRGRADLARPPGGAEGAAVRRGPRPAAAASGSRSRPRPRRSCTTPTSCRSTPSAASAACTTTPCSSSRAAPWPT